MVLTSVPFFMPVVPSKDMEGYIREVEKYSGGSSKEMQRLARSAKLCKFMAVLKANCCFQFTEGKYQIIGRSNITEYREGTRELGWRKTAKNIFKLVCSILFFIPVTLILLVYNAFCKFKTYDNAGATGHELDIERFPLDQTIRLTKFQFQRIAKSRMVEIFNNQLQYFDTPNISDSVFRVSLPDRLRESDGWVISRYRINVDMEIGRKTRYTVIPDRESHFELLIKEFGIHFPSENVSSGECTVGSIDSDGSRRTWIGFRSSSFRISEFSNHGFSIERLAPQ